MTNAYIALGSNQGDSLKILNEAIAAIGTFANTRVIKISGFYWNAFQGMANQPQASCLNAVILIDTDLTPQILLEELLNLENNYGRSRTGRGYSARTLDLDILIYDHVVCQTDTLTLPHPRMHERNFVIFPLRDINPELPLPNGQHIAELCKQMTWDGVLAQRPQVITGFS